MRILRLRFRISYKKKKKISGKVVFFFFPKQIVLITCFLERKEVQRVRKVGKRKEVSWGPEPGSTFNTF